MARKKKQLWKVGDYFTIPLADGSFSIGQVVGQEKEALNSVICAFFTRHYPDAPHQLDQALVDQELVAVLFVTRDSLDSGDWKVIFSGDTFPISHYMDIAYLKASGFVGVRVIGSQIILDFMNAYYGFYSWDGYYEPDYFDKLLVSLDRKPSKLLFK